MGLFGDYSSAIESILDKNRAIEEKYLNMVNYSSPIKVRFNFIGNDGYTPIDINVCNKEDVTKLNIVFNYLMNKATITSDLNTNKNFDYSYSIDMRDNN
jgi:hypothetical protein